MTAWLWEKGKARRLEVRSAWLWLLSINANLETYPPAILTRGPQRFRAAFVVGRSAPPTHKCLISKQTKTETLSLALARLVTVIWLEQKVILLDDKPTLSYLPQAATASRAAMVRFFGSSMYKADPIYGLTHELTTQARGGLCEFTVREVVVVLLFRSEMFRVNSVCAP